MSGMYDFINSLYGDDFMAQHNLEHSARGSNTKAVDDGAKRDGERGHTGFGVVTGHYMRSREKFATEAAAQKEAAVQAANWALRNPQAREFMFVCTVDSREYYVHFSLKNGKATKDYANFG